MHNAIDDIRGSPLYLFITIGQASQPLARVNTFVTVSRGHPCVHCGTDTITHSDNVRIDKCNLGVEINLFNWRNTKMVSNKSTLDRYRAELYLNFMFREEE